MQCHDTKSKVKDKFKTFLEEMRRFKFQITLVITFEKELNNGELTVNDLNIAKTLKLSYQNIMSRIRKRLGESLHG